MPWSLCAAHHEFHDRVAAWIKAVRFPALVTCSITESGFVRVLAQAPSYGFTVTQARTFLLRLQKTDALTFTFIPDDHGVSHLPTWSNLRSRQRMDISRNLRELHQAILATLDERIPGAYLIP